MELVRSGLGALVGGAVGAALWAAVAYYFDYEIGWIAWGIGALAGIGARIGAKEEASVATGILAAVIALAGVCAGKYAVVSLHVSRWTAEMQDSDLPEELLVSYVADEVVTEALDAGRTIDWPQDPEFAFPEAEEDYPADVWREAESRWSAMDSAERRSFRFGIEEERRAGAEAMAGEFTAQAFRDSFGGMDLLFAFLAVATAFKLGSGFATVSQT